MLFGLLADIVVLVHLLWILFLITGAYWGRKNRFFLFLHGGGLSFAVIMQVFGWYCPLTHLEVWLRSLQGGEGYHGSFIAHYAERVIYLDVTGRMLAILTFVLVAANGWLYWKAFKKKDAS